MDVLSDSKLLAVSNQPLFGAPQLNHAPTLCQCLDQPEFRRSQMIPTWHGGRSHHSELSHGS